MKKLLLCAIRHKDKPYVDDCVYIAYGPDAEVSCANWLSDNNYVSGHYIFHREFEFDNGRSYSDVPAWCIGG